MRLSNRIVGVIKKAIKSSFGDVEIYLFGSRVDDLKMGGDIDIAIDTDLSREEFKQKKVKFFSNLLRMDFDYKIDLVQLNKKDKLLYDEIISSRIKIG